VPKNVHTLRVPVGARRCNVNPAIPDDHVVRAAAVGNRRELVGFLTAYCEAYCEMTISAVLLIGYVEEGRNGKMKLNW
jgi:hypothetical protein